MKIMGLDISTKTGVVVVEKIGDSLEVVDAAKITSKPAVDRMDRWHGYAESVVQMYREHQPEAVVIENYGFGNKHTLVVLVEVGTIIRSALRKEGARFLEVPPTTLKLFLSGKGNADKNLMLLNLYKIHGIETDDDDICDAITAALVGFQLSGEPVTRNSQSLKTIDKWRKNNKDVLAWAGMA